MLSLRFALDFDTMSALILVSERRKPMERLTITQVAARYDVTPRMLRRLPLHWHEKEGRGRHEPFRAGKPSR